MLTYFNLLLFWFGSRSCIGRFCGALYECCLGFGWLVGSYYCAIEELEPLEGLWNGVLGVWNHFGGVLAFIMLRLLSRHLWLCTKRVRLWPYRSAVWPYTFDADF